MSQLNIPSSSYTPRSGLSPFTAGTHFAQQKQLNKEAVLASTTNLMASKATPRFGTLNSASLKQLSPLTQTAYKLFGPIWRNRGIELLFIDLVAFAGIRSGMDFCREYLFKNTIHEKKSFNWAAGRERLMLEVMGGMPDGIGLLAFMYGAFAEKVPFWHGKKAFSNQFTNIDTLNYFRSIVKNPAVQKSQDFIKQLAGHIAPSKADKILPLLNESILKSVPAENTAAKMAKLLNQTHMEREILGNTFALNTLIEDAHHLVKAVAKSTPGKVLNGRWSQQAQKLLLNTARINNFRIPAGVALGLLFNGASPYIIQAVTRHIEGINDYVGEQGLRELNVVNKDKEIKTTKRGFLPYIRESLSNGNPLPLLVSLVPLPIVFGWLDAEKLANSGLKASWNGLKPGWQKFLNMMQFGKAWPYVGGGQTAMLYAFCVFSRIAAARNAVEFRERTVDAFLGWSIFILATPRLKRWASVFFDKNHGTQLMKNVGGQLERKSESEILKLIKNPKTLQKTLSAFVKINVGAILGTIFLLGIVEPYLSIKITEWQSQWMSRRRKQYHERAQRYTQPFGVNKKDAV